MTIPSRREIERFADGWRVLDQEHPASNLSFEHCKRGARDERVTVVRHGGAILHLSRREAATLRDFIDSLP